MNSLTSLHRRILSELQEAGEEDLSALVNTVQGDLDSFDEVQTIISAVADLVRCHLTCTAIQRDGKTLRWVPLSPDVSLAMLQSATQKFQWFTQERIWKWPHDVDRPVVLLTEKGFKQSVAILTEDGWPRTV